MSLMYPGTCMYFRSLSLAFVKKLERNVKILNVIDAHVCTFVHEAWHFRALYDLVHLDLRSWCTVFVQRSNMPGFIKLSFNFTLRMSLSSLHTYWKFIRPPKGLTCDGCNTELVLSGGLWWKFHTCCLQTVNIISPTKLQIWLKYNIFGFDITVVCSFRLCMSLSTATLNIQSRMGALEKITL